MLIVLLQILTLGSFSFADCLAPDESSLPEGASMTYFKTEFRPDHGQCESLPLICNGGVLMVDRSNPIGRSIASVTNEQIKDYKFISCLNELRCADPRKPAGEFILGGESVEAYKSTVGPCQKETRFCDPSTGALSGTFRHETCMEPKDK